MPFAVSIVLGRGGRLSKGGTLERRRQELEGGGYQRRRRGTTGVLVISDVNLSLCIEKKVDRRREAHEKA